MCGIVGFRSTHGVDHLRDSLSEAVSLIRHRGPDDQGEWFGTHVGLGFARLSILDLSMAGHQPMTSPDGRYVIVYNGEAYNFKELRTELEASGEAFSTATDTEVVLRLYIKEGEKCLNKINGMFALAVYDTLKDTIFFARDRFGKKPLYLYRFPGGLLFGSEVKALLPFVTTLGLDWRLNDALLFEYFLFRYNAGNDTLIHGLEKCPAGSFLEIDKEGRERSGRYYELESTDGSSEISDEADAVEFVAEQLRSSISLRCRSDAPIGVALSGGVDSSLITFLMRDVYDSEIRTYSVVFEQKSDDGRVIDESPFSDYVAEECGTTHTRVTLTSSMFSDHYLHAAWLNDEPLNYPNSIGIHLLSKYAAKDVKVLLGGEGADEMFAGYDFFKDDFGATLKPFVRDVDARSLLVPPHQNSFRLGLAEHFGTKHINDRISVATRTYLVSILNRLDKMSMGASLEFRAPFLDHRVVAASRRLSERLRVNEEQITKAVLKKLAERYMPKSFLYRPKVGFSTPLNHWLRDRTHIGRYVDILDEERTLRRPHLNRDAVTALVRDFRRGDDSFEFSIAGRVWILLNLEIWIRMFLEDKRALV